MLDTEKDILRAASDQAAALAGVTSESFALAILAAYMAGKQAANAAA